MRKAGVLLVAGFVVCIVLGGIAHAQDKTQDVKIIKETAEQMAVQQAKPSDASISQPKVLPPIGGASSNYTLGVGDILDITVRNNPEFSGRFSVGPDGNLQYTFIGDIKAEGFTKQQLKEKIEKELVKYIKVPEVDITIAAYLSKFVYCLGAVGRPGKYPMQGDTVTLRDLIVGAGLPNPDAALRRTFVIKPDVTNPTFKKVDLVLLLYKGVLKDDLVLEPGTVVFVPTTVPSEINKALTVFLSPFNQGRNAADMVNYYRTGGRENAGF